MSEPLTRFEVVETKKASKEVTSLWFVTVSSNQRLEALGEDGVKHFKESMVALWSKPYGLLKCAHGEQGVGRLCLPPRDKILEIESRISWEVGKEKQFLHMHGTVKVRHCSKILLDFARINNVLRDFSGPDRAWNFRADYVPAAAVQSRLDAYMTKSLPDEEVFVSR